MEMRQGFDLELSRSVAREVTIPVVASGGGGELKHFRQVIREAGVARLPGGSQSSTKASIEPY